MDPNTENWILEIKGKASSLREASEALEHDINCNPFDLDDAKLCFQEVKEYYDALVVLLSEESDE